MQRYWRIVDSVLGTANGARWQRNLFAIVVAGIGVVIAWQLGVFDG